MRNGQHHAPVGVDFEPVSFFHEYGGEVGLHDGRSFDPDSGRQVVGRENGGFGPGAGVYPPRALGGSRCRCSVRFLRQNDGGQFPGYRGPQRDQADFLVELMVGVEDPVSFVKKCRPGTPDRVVVLVQIRYAHVDFIDLVQVPHVGGELGGDVIACQSLFPELRGAVFRHAVRQPSHFVQVDYVQAGRE